MTDFFHKYTPTTLDDISMDKYDRKILKGYQSGSMSGSIILYGPVGTGKSTAAQIIGSSRRTGNPRIYPATMTAREFDRIEKIGNHVPLGREHDMVIINEVDRLPDELLERLTDLCDPLYATQHFIFERQTTLMASVKRCRTGRKKSGFFAPPRPSGQFELKLFSQPRE